MTIKKGLALLAASISVAASPAFAAGGSAQIERQNWPFSGIFGQYDETQLQRGFQVYKEVCSACHGLTRIAFRNLSEPGGPNFPEAQVKAMAATYEIPAGPNDEGEMYTRPGRLSDKFPALYANDKAARMMNGGALPPDLSLIAKARGVPHPDGVFTHVLTMASDIATGYQEAGADYIYALLTSYKDEPPEGFELQDLLYYNAAYPGNQIAMAPPLYDQGIVYEDGTEATVSQQAKDVSAFLQWAADPSHDQRKQMGWVALLYLIITAALLYVAKRKVWANVKH